MKHPNLLDPLAGSIDAAEAVHAARQTGLGLVIDNFAGGGGASSGIEAAIGRAIDVAINHDPEAIAMHQANHPGTHHYCQSVWKADPQRVVDDLGGGPVALAWFSPDCKHFSKAKGGKPVEKKIRDLAWVVVTWAQRVQPRVIMLENVEEFITWAPLDKDGRPIEAGASAPETLRLVLNADDAPTPPTPRKGKSKRPREGETFQQWVGELRRAGYRVQWKELRACDYGAPTSRKRLFIIARSDGLPIIWPEPTHGKPGSPEVISGARHPWRTAAEIIDWSIPCPSIFTRKKPLKDATCRRIAHGIMRFVINSPKPFIVPVCHTQARPSAKPGDEPLQTVTTAKGGELAVVEPFLAPLTHQGDDGRTYSLGVPIATVTGAHRGEIALVAPIFARTAHGERDRNGKKRGKGDHGPAEPFPTVLSSQDSALITATIVGCGGRRGQSGPVDVAGPYPTTTAKADACLVAVTLDRQFGRSLGADAGMPAPTITAGGSGKTAVLAATLVKSNFGTNPAQHVTVPLHTITTQGNKFGVLAATLIQTSYGEREGQAPRVLQLDMPLGTIVAGGIKHSIATAVLVPHIMTMRSAQKPHTGADEPTHTITAGGAHLNLVSAFLHKYRPDHPGISLDEPAPTVTANSYIKRPGGAPPLALVTAHIAQHNSDKSPKAGRSAEAPLSTITSSGSHQQVVASSLIKLRGTGRRHGQPLDEPLHTITAGGTHYAEVAAFLVKYYGAHQHGQAADQPLDTVTSLARFGLVTVTIDGEQYVIADIGMRMLTPRELARAQGFPDDYVLDPLFTTVDKKGREKRKPLTKTAQIRMIGNSVCPPFSEALVRANLGQIEPVEEAEAA